MPCGSDEQDVLDEIESQLLLLGSNSGFYRTSEGRIPTYFDLVSGETNHGQQKNIAPNGVIDAVAIVWRNNPTVGAKAPSFPMTMQITY